MTFIYMYIYISLSRVLCSFGSKKQTDMAAELPIDDEVAHGNMPAKGTKVAKLVAMAKGFLPECKVQDFPPEPEMACMKMSCFMSCWFAERISKPDARLIFGEAYPYLKGGEKNAIINPPAPKVLGRDLPDGTRKRLQVYLGGEGGHFSAKTSCF